MTAPQIAGGMGSPALAAAGLALAVDAAPSAPSARVGVRLAVTPNPVRGRATVRVERVAPGPLRVGLVDVLGCEVSVLEDSEQAAGTHAVTLDATRLPSGGYLVRVQTPGGGTA